MNSTTIAPPHGAPSFGRLLRFQASSTIASGTIIGPLVSSVVSACVVAGLSQDVSNAARVGPILHLILWVVFGGQMALFVALARYQRTETRDFLKRLPIDGARRARSEVALDTLIVLVPALIAFSIVGFRDPSLGLIILTVHVWGLFCGILLSRVGRRGLGLTLAYFAGALPAALVGVALALENGEQHFLIVTIAVLMAGVVGVVVIYTKAAALEVIESKPTSTQTTHGPGWRLPTGLPSHTLPGLLSHGNPLFSVWLLVAVGFGVAAYFAPSESFIVLWSWILSLQMGTAFAISLTRDVTEFLLTRPIPRFKLYLTPVVIGVLGALIVPVMGFIGTRSTESFEPHMHERLGLSPKRYEQITESAEPPTDGMVNDARVWEALESRYRTRLAKSFWVHELPDGAILRDQPLQFIDNQWIPAYGASLAKQCRTGLQARWTFSLFVALAWFFGMLILLTRGTAESTNARRQFRTLFEPRVFGTLAVLLGLTAPIFQDAPWRPAPPWLLSILVVTLAVIGWRRLMKYEVR